MKKMALVLVAFFMCSTLLLAQETTIIQNENQLFQEAKHLFEEKKYGASNQAFSDFMAQCSHKQGSLYQEAVYYQACIAYETKSTDAITQLKDYLDTYPYAPMRSRVIFMLGRLSFEKKQYSQALKWYNQIQNDQLCKTESQEYLYTKGYSLIMVKQYKQASYIFESLMSQQNRYSEDAAYYYAYSEFCQKHYSKATPVFKRLLNYKQYGEASAYHLLQIYQEEGNYAETTATGKELIAKYPKSKYNSEAYRILGEAAYRQKEYKDAITYFTKYENEEKKVQRNDMYMLGMSYYNLKEYQKAVTNLSKVTTEKDSLSQNAYMYVGHSYLALDNPANARMAFQAASSMDYDKQLQEEAFYNYVLATYESDAPFGEMVGALDRFLALYPNSSHLDNIYGCLASVYMNEKNYEAAIESIDKMKTSNPKLLRAKENALFQLGVSAFLDKDYNKALSYFSQSIELYTPKSYSAQAYLWRGETYYRLGNQQACRENIKTFLSRSQEKTEEETLKAYYTLAYSYFDSKEYSQARQWFTKYIDTETNHFTKYYNDALNRLGDTYYVARNFDKAKYYYGQVSPKAITADYAAYQRGFILGIQKQYDAKIAAMNNLVLSYGRSEYIDDALYEIGRTYVLMERPQQAITAYQRLMKERPKSYLSRKAALEIGLLNANQNKYDDAIAAYKMVIETYPSSEEARVAIESMEGIYIERDQVSDYVAYRESVSGASITSISRGAEDSLTFIAAERLFAKADYPAAINSLKKYIEKFCETRTSNCVSAQYYLAESYYLSNDKENALIAFDRLTNMDGNSYMESSLLRASELAYDAQKFPEAKHYFEQLYENASSKANKSAARLGMLRTSYSASLYSDAIKNATILIEDDRSDDGLVREARYVRAKSHIALYEPEQAKSDLQILSKELRYEMGAEAKYLYAQYLYDQNAYKMAETEVMDLIQKNTPHQYWLARGFILLADIYIAQDDEFQAKQYLLSLQENYRGEDDIQSMISTRLAKIEAIEKESVY